MKFLSIKEYFYKINTIGFILLLVPLLLYIFLYMQSAERMPLISSEESILILLGGTILVFAIDLTIVQMILAMRIKKYLKRVELAGRMDGYFYIAIIRMATYCGGALLTAVGFYLTSSSYFVAVFLMIDIMGILQWPTPAAFCSAFKLDGSEREMVLFNRDLK